MGGGSPRQRAAGQGGLKEATEEGKEGAGPLGESDPVAESCSRRSSCAGWLRLLLRPQGFVRAGEGCGTPHLHINEDVYKLMHLI